MAYTFGARLDDDSYALTTIDEDQGTASTKGEINGVPFEGGGGGDYTTAEVTVVSTSNTRCMCAVPYIYDDEGHEGLYLLDLIGNDTAELTVPLYKGSCQAIFTLEALSIAVTGDITEDHGYCIITGNGTITITD